jgi:methyltransferase (TIGR00027 family)
MQGQEPSRTARLAAAARAVHQTLEGGRVFTDPFARRIIDEPSFALLEAANTDTKRSPSYYVVVARSRFAEDALAAAVERGVRQAVVLGAGLDTLGLRNPYAAKGLRVFEVDHPATQAWKRERLRDVGIAMPTSLVFAPVDFERDDLADGLRTSGFRAEEPSFFLWLGVVVYLTRAAVFGTLRAITGMPEAEVVFTYSETPERLSPARRDVRDLSAKRVAALGEPWLSHFVPEELSGELRTLGFAKIEDIDFAGLVARYFDLPAATHSGAHIIHARH